MLLSDFCLHQTTVNLHPKRSVPLVLTSRFYDFTTSSSSISFSASSFSFPQSRLTYATSVAPHGLASTAASASAPAPVLFEWYRSHLLRSLRLEFDKLNDSWLQRCAVKESFNRWLYLQLATPTILVPNQDSHNNSGSTSSVSDASLHESLTKVYANILPLDRLCAPLDPLIRFPSAAAYSQVCGFVRRSVCV
jgi:hypothetical protein